MEHAASLMFALSHGALTLLHAVRYERARKLIDELIDVAESKGPPTTGKPMASSCRDGWPP